MAGEVDLYQVSLKVILRNDQGEVLAARGLPSSSYAGYHDLPGGRITADEFDTPFSAIIARELREEVGTISYRLNEMPVAVARHVIPAAITKARTRDVHVLQLFFEADYEGGDLEGSDEHEVLRWVDLDAVKLDALFRSGVLDGITNYLKLRSLSAATTRS